jgi:hypothetical protein
MSWCWQEVMQKIICDLIAAPLRRQNLRIKNAPVSLYDYLKGKERADNEIVRLL